ncbi:MAG: MFS transporter, partial [Vicinamibacteria bacterium]
MAEGTPAARRSLVPSQREAEAGVVALPPPADAAPAMHDDERSSTGERVRGVLADLNPRRIVAGRPMMPMAVLALFALVAQWDDQALGILLPDMRADFAFDLQFLFTLQSVLYAATLLLAPLVGYLADRAPRVWLVRGGALMSNAASVGIGLAGGIPQLVLARTALGVGASVQQPAGLPLISDYYPSTSRARVIAFIGVAGALGGVAGPLIGGYLGLAFGWRTAVVTLGLVAMAVYLPTLLAIPIASWYLGAPATPAEAAGPRWSPRRLL